MESKLARRIGSTVLTLMAVLLAVRMALLAADALRRPACCFVTYYTAAQMVRDGEPVDRFYDRDWFSEHVRQREPAIYDIWGNPPPAAFIMLPLTRLDQREARAVWTWVNVVLMVALVWALGRAAGLGSVAFPAFACVAFIFQPVHQTLRSGQVYIVVLAFTMLAWLGYRSRREAALGGSLGLLGTFKIAGVWHLPQLLAERRWRALAWSAAVAIAVFGLSLHFVGIAAWVEAARFIAAVPREIGISVTAYQSLPGFFQHVFVRVPTFNPDPLLHAPLVGSVLWWATAAILIGTSLLTAARRPGRDSVFAMFVVLGILISPISAGPHFMPVLLAIAILLAGLQRHPSMIGAAVLAAGIVAIAADVPYRSPRFASGLVSLLAYPRMYGALLLWALAVQLSWAKEKIMSKEDADRRATVLSRLSSEIASSDPRMVPFPFR
jgi:hypothetical protein